ncbi:inositol polyphosphate multikinase alpha-like [Aphis craccivora]|uniref:Kinase n=1 Tax=Aphis craccivora TaxID=307492 RepID=A0A6G0YQ54_APHCR|nr:inositol polyphosphate multikinase alpha-like [Aphis craccivora]
MMEKMWLDSDDLLPYDNQVGGHKFTKEKPLLGLLKHKEGYILKSVEGGTKGKNEVRFYEELRKNENLINLRKLVPLYYGTATLEINKKDMTFIILDDITTDMKKPCVMDVKIGLQTWEPGCSEKKKNDENAKYTRCKEKWSFCIPGFQVYDLSNSNLVQPQKYDKEFGKSLDPGQVISVFKTFLNLNSGYLGLEKLVQSFTTQLDHIRRYFQTQKHYHFYSSSVLLAYDAETLKNDKNTYPLIRVSLIDFAHVTPADGNIDLNYLQGITNLWTLFRTQLLNNN